MSTRPQQFAAWVKDQQQPRRRRTPAWRRDAHVFETEACMNCHTIAGTAAAKGKFGPDLTHLMSRGTIAAGACHEHARESARSGSRIRTTSSPASLMPAMQLNDQQLDELVATSLRFTKTREEEDGRSNSTNSRHCST